MAITARWYEDVAVPAVFAPFAKDLVQSAAAQPGERVLDVACGTGIVARSLAGTAPRQAMITGIDMRLPPLEVALEAAVQRGLHVGFVTGAAERLPFPAGSFDLILCQSGLMLFDDPAAALGEMKRVLAAEGRLLLNVWDSIDRHPLDKDIHARSLQRLGASGLEGVYSLADERTFRNLITSSGFEDVAIEHVAVRVSFPDPYGYLDWQMQVDPILSPVLRDLNTAGRQALLASVRQGLESTLQQYIQDGKVMLEMHALKAKCRRPSGQ